eukprot:m.61846 g.61846  ORF g.61846 m.61846 type:complete len:413 (-) comp7106_c0_seq1:32-1270(-)
MDKAGQQVSVSDMQQYAALTAAYNQQLYDMYGAMGVNAMPQMHNAMSAWSWPYMQPMQQVQQMVYLSPMAQPVQQAAATRTQPAWFGDATPQQPPAAPPVERKSPKARPKQREARVPAAAPTREPRTTLADKAASAPAAPPPAPAPPPLAIVPPRIIAIPFVRRKAPRTRKSKPTAQQIAFMRAQETKSAPVPTRCIAVRRPVINLVPKAVPRKIHPITATFTEVSKDVLDEIEKLRLLYVRHKKAIVRLDTLSKKLAADEPMQLSEESSRDSLPDTQQARRPRRSGAPTPAENSKATAAASDTEGTEPVRRNGLRTAAKEEPATVTRTSNGARIYVCPTCSRTFTHGPAFSQHTRFHQRDTDTEARDDDDGGEAEEDAEDEVRARHVASDAFPFSIPLVLDLFRCVDAEFS